MFRDISAEVNNDVGVIYLPPLYFGDGVRDNFL